MNTLYSYSMFNSSRSEDRNSKRVCVCVQPGGSVFITTISRTQLSYMLAIVMAEQVLRIVPKGTHEWDKFISPVELETILESCESSSYTHQRWMDVKAHIWIGEWM